MEIEWIRCVDVLHLALCFTRKIQKASFCDDANVQRQAWPIDPCWNHINCDEALQTVASPTLAHVNRCPTQFVRARKRLIKSQPRYASVRRTRRGCAKHVLTRRNGMSEALSLPIQG